MIENWAWKGPQIIKNKTSGCFGEVLGALGFMNAERHAQENEKWSHFGATWSILIRWVFLYVFGATAKTRQNIKRNTILLQKLENAKQRRT